MSENSNPALNAASLLKLLTLSSTALPIGAYCYSQGVESAIECGLVNNEKTALAYFEDVLELLLVRYELPMLAQLMEAVTDAAAFTVLASEYKASRETREFLLESQQLAFSLNAWIKQVLELEVQVESQYGFVPVYAQLCARLQLSPEDCLTAYCFSVLENQVLAAVKTVPLGQMSGQRILWKLHQRIPQAVQQALNLQGLTSSLSSNLPNFSMLSMQHETQYSRLFRS
ncbi:MAG: urease accessory protein [Moraxellaceae bacterium]|nr:MAG: urease accessory protein [Moraxellaceae bacterium]